MFYSGKTEPGLLTLCVEGLAYLKDQGIKLKVVEIAKNMEKAKELNVESTPTVLIEREEEIVKRYEAVSGWSSGKGKN